MSKHFLVDPTAEIVNKKIPLFTDDLLGDDSRKDISSAMEKEMVRYGGIGLSANQIVFPFRMFIMFFNTLVEYCLLYTSQSTRDTARSRIP